MAFKLSEQSLKTLYGTNIELAKVIFKAAELSSVEFEVVTTTMYPEVEITYGATAVKLHLSSINPSRISHDIVIEAVKEAAKFWGVRDMEISQVVSNAPIVSFRTIHVQLSKPEVKSTWYGELKEGNK